MKKGKQKIGSCIGGLNGIAFILYCVFVFVNTIFTSDNFTLFYLLIGSVAILGIALLLCPVVLRGFSKLRIPPEEVSTSCRRKKWYTAFFFLLPFTVFLTYYFAFYPGSYTPDSMNQYQQAITNRYNDWHPVMQTLLSFKLPLALTGGWFASVALFQVLIFSGALGYSFRVIYQHSNFKYTAIAMAFVLLHPQMGTMAITPWKDVVFAIGALLLTTYALQILMSKGQWLRKPINLAAFVAVLVVTTLVRHNAVLFTVPLTIGVLFCVSFKRALLISVSAGILFLGIKFPVYSMIGVEQPGQRQVETLGLPMTVIGAVVTYAPDALDKETKEFAYQVAPKEVWEESFHYGSYNSIKWNAQTNNAVIEEYGAAKVISMMLRCFKNAPVCSLHSLVSLTEGIYSLSNSHNSVGTPGVAENEYGIIQKGNRLLADVCDGYISFAEEMLPHVFLYLGNMHLLLLASLLAKNKLLNRNHWKRIMVVLAVFVYNFGTALLLTGAGDVGRFFFYTFPLMPVLLLLIYTEDNEGNADFSVCRET